MWIWQAIDILNAIRETEWENDASNWGICWGGNLNSYELMIQCWVGIIFWLTPSVQDFLCLLLGHLPSSVPCEYAVLYGTNHAWKPSGFSPISLHFPLGIDLDLLTVKYLNLFGKLTILGLVSANLYMMCLIVTWLHLRMTLCRCEVSVHNIWLDCGLWEGKDSSATYFLWRWYIGTRSVQVCTAAWLQ